MKILILNGPNLNLLGEREPEIYGHKQWSAIIEDLKQAYPAVDLDFFQSNLEGELVDQIQGATAQFEGLILNAGGYTHTSVALRDALATIKIPVIEVHISNPAAREPFRHQSLMASFVKGSIAGFGINSYRLAIDALITYL